MYTLQAIIMNKPSSSVATELGLKIVPLLCDLYMVPLPNSFISEKSLPFQPLTDGEIDDFYGELEHICLEFSRDRDIAYVEAEFFGGAGTQGCALYSFGEEIQEPIVDDEAINIALNWLGISKSSKQDEFSIVGLGMHRNTEQWLNA